MVNGAHPRTSQSTVHRADRGVLGRNPLLLFILLIPSLRQHHAERVGHDPYGCIRVGGVERHANPAERDRHLRPAAKRPSPPVGSIR